MRKHGGLGRELGTLALPLRLEVEVIRLLIIVFLVVLLVMAVPVLRETAKIEWADYKEDRGRQAVCVIIVTPSPTP